LQKPSSVPANLRLPTVGEVSVLGTIDVDARTGAILVPKTKQITQMQELAHAIAAHFAVGQRIDSGLAD